jgi:hypothetical protein
MNDFMNPLLQSALGAIIRWALTFGAGYLVSKGIWTQEESAVYVTAAVTGVLTLLWAVWKRYRDERLVNTALAMPGGATRTEAHEVIAAGAAPPASVKANHIPFLEGTPNPGKDDKVGG